MSQFFPVYGNEPTLGICYQAAAILVAIPCWSARHGVEMELSQ